MIHVGKYLFRLPQSWVSSLDRDLGLRRYVEILILANWVAVKERKLKYYSKE